MGAKPTDAVTTDVMWDQFAYVMDHESLGSCPKGCVDCRKRNRLRKILMAPFEEKTKKKTGAV
jgi:hypothetical protein